MPEPRNLPPPNQAIQPTWSGYDAEPPDQSAVPLSHYLWILRRHRWKILGFVLGCARHWKLFEAEADRWGHRFACYLLAADRRSAPEQYLCKKAVFDHRSDRTSCPS